jgi:hypothetical protein
VSSAPLALDPGARALLRFAPASAESGALAARLDPGDALADDDQLTLELPREPTVSVRVDPMCAATLRQALRANSGLRNANPGESEDLAVTCVSGAEHPGPGLMLRRGGSLQAAAHLRWLDEDRFPGQLPLERLRLRVWDSPLAARPGDQVIIASGAAPLAIRRAPPARVLETTLDLEDRELAAEHAYPLLIAALIDRAAGRALEGGYVAAREPSESQIAPRERLSAGMDSRSSPIGLDLTPYVLALALVLMALELAFAVLTLARDLRYYRRDP